MSLVLCFRNAKRSSIIICEVPSEDHTYSLPPPARSPATSSDDAYESAHSPMDSDNDAVEESDFDEDNVSDAETEAVYHAALQRIKQDADVARAAAPTIARRVFESLTAAASTRHAEEQAEEQKLAESATALLNLAGIKTEADTEAQVRATISRGASPTMLAGAAISPNTANNNNSTDKPNKMVKAEPSVADSQEEDMDQT